MCINFDKYGNVVNMSEIIPFPYMNIIIIIVTRLYVVQAIGRVVDTVKVGPCFNVCCTRSVLP